MDDASKRLKEPLLPSAQRPEVSFPADEEGNASSQIWLAPLLEPDLTQVKTPERHDYVGSSDWPVLVQGSNELGTPSNRPIVEGLRALVGSPTARRNSTMSKQDVLEQFDEELVLPQLQSDAQTILNTINLYVGVGLLSTGYAVRLGGWASLLVLGASTFVFSWTAKLLCWAAEALPPGTVPSYPNIGKAALGPAGQWTVMAAVLLEFWGALGMCLIVLWQSIAILLPAGALCWFGHCFTARHVAVAGSALVVVPAVLVRTFSRLTSISLSGVTGSALICAVVVAAYALDPGSAMVEDPAARHHEAVHWPSLPIAAGIFIVSLSGHAGLPSLRRSMANPAHFEHCISVTFFTMFCLYACMGSFAYLYFGDSLQVLVTASLNASSSVANVSLLRLGSFSISISQALTALVALSVYSTIPALVYVMAELVLDLSEGTAFRHPRGLLEPLVRMVVLGVAYVTALVAYDVLAHVESLVGGVCSVLVSLILPAIFYYRLYRPQLSWWQRSLLYTLVTFGILAALGIFVKNVIELTR